MKYDTSQLKKVMLQTITYECSICRLSNWLGESISLHVDHIDGVRANNELSNLRFLCPNCHSQTSTFCGRNTDRTKRKIFPTGEEVTEKIQEMKQANKSVSITSLLSSLGFNPCGQWYRDQLVKILKNLNIELGSYVRPTKIEWPCDEDLIEMIITSGYKKVGRILGVSDNSIRKRLNARGHYPKFKNK